MAHLPKYTGVTVTLPGGIKTHPYFKATNVADWSLQGFMTATGKDENSFLSAIGNLAKFKPVPRDVRSFARSLHDLYGGIFRDQVVDIAKDDAKSRINRQSFIRKEKLITQRSYKDDLEQNLRAKDQGGASSCCECRKNLLLAGISVYAQIEWTTTGTPEFIPVLTVIPHTYCTHWLNDLGLQSANINSELSEEPTDTVNPEFKEHGTLSSQVHVKRLFDISLSIK
ncbi:hypothetical protein BGW38_000908 [Lunasporangiospora selenospora]|uniref:Uncharacterized protein n=1 Tax=Lunasporangiospora selenospora TaxID=979761 RepID=A0A9P6G1P4_9FUNG|nr:hypothetical protein BGW38_000908 [Lunasporangiospora selenospora]